MQMRIGEVTSLGHVADKVAFRGAVFLFVGTTIDSLIWLEGEIESPSAVDALDNGVTASSRVAGPRKLTIQRGISITQGPSN